MISMQDIAARANVSRTTVSLALNDRYINGVGISEELRRRIKTIAADCGYRPNALASSMAKGKSRLIGCLGLDPSQEAAFFVGQIMTAAVKAATDDDYALKLLSSDSTVEQLLDECCGYRMSGVIIRNRDHHMLKHLLEGLKSYKIPAVLVDTDYYDLDVSTVNSDDAEGIRLAVHHLYDLGHRRFAYIAFEDFTPFTIVRRGGYQKGLEECGLDIATNPCYYTDPAELRHPYDRGETLATELLQTGASRPTAIIGNCDEVALLALRAAWRLGIKVPEELSVIGVGNIPPDLFSCPPLTTVGRPYLQMGSTAISKIINSPDKISATILPVDLVIRQSTAKCHDIQSIDNKQT